MQYWAYLHKYGNIEIKEWYPGNSFIHEATVSPYVVRFLEAPFEAESFEEAEETAGRLLKDN
jgi:hypothetical protein